MDYTDYLRIVNAIAAGLAFVSFAVRLNDDIARLSTGWRVTRFAMLGLVFVFGFGSIELLLTQPPVPVGVRVYLALTCLIALNIGLWMVRKDGPPDDGWIRASDIQGILDEVEQAHAGGCNPPAPGCLLARDRMRVAIKDARKVAAR